jgi:hypothetical protein
MHQVKWVTTRIDNSKYYSSIEFHVIDGYGYIDLFDYQDIQQ